MSVIGTAFKGSPVLVTGASGFIGGHLALRLAGEEGAQVVGSGRSFKGDAETKLRGAGVELARADLADAAAMERLCEGKSVVFHLAAWLMRGNGGDAEAYKINVDATRSLVQAASRAGVKRFVLVSSVAAYGLPPVDDIDETVPIDISQPDLYGRTKALGEEAARDVAAGSGLSLSILRPAMVYGPGSMGWTVAMLRLVEKGVPVLLGDASGHAFPVYIDDVVDALLLAGARPEASGEAFNVSDASVTWETFFGYYGRMCGKNPRRVPMLLARLIAAANEKFHLNIPLTVDRLKICVRKLRFPTAKAARLLGWKVSVPIGEGMRRSEVWLRETGKLR
ncbi:MAG: NAD(P)-dependent oxidoreductase [Polyangiaceae bacterium]|nr:NAD(P)-dependent oxidoreductase [Polyangiaceae bacterium]